MGEIGAGKNDSPNIKNMGKGADSDKLAEVVRDQQEERRKSPTKEPMKISAETGSQDPKAKQVLDGFSVSEPNWTSLTGKRIKAIAPKRSGLVMISTGNGY